MSDRVVERRNFPFGTVFFGFAAIYTALDITEVWSGAISGDHSNTILESKGVAEAAEALRTKKMIIEHVFGGGAGTGGAPDPDDDDGFTRIIARAAIYGGVIAELTRRLGLAPSAGSRWVSGKNRPPRYARKTVIETLRDIFNSK